MKLTQNEVLGRLVTLVMGLTPEMQRKLLSKLEVIYQETFCKGKRCFPRRAYPPTITFKANGTHYTGAIRDISAGGMFIRTPAQFHMGGNVILELPFLREGQNIQVAAEVVRVEKEGIGVEFMRYSK